jgi:ATP-dependent protease ClpP protease subunit
MILLQKLSLALAAATTLCLSGACVHAGKPLPDPIHQTRIVTEPEPPAPEAPAPAAAPADPPPSTNADDTADDTGLHKPKYMKHFVEVVTFRGGIDPDNTKALSAIIEAANASRHDPKQDPVEAFVFVYDTEGGQVPAGSDLIDELQSLEMPLVCVVNGDAYSMGMLILQTACPVRLMTNHSALMAHEPHYQGEVKITLHDPGRIDFQGIADEMEASFRGWVQIMAERMHMDPEVLLAKMRGTMWFMDPKEALKNGAVDAVIGNITRDVLKPLEEELVLPPRLGVPAKLLQAPAAEPQDALPAVPAGSGTAGHRPHRH